MRRLGKLSSQLPLLIYVRQERKEASGEKSCRINAHEIRDSPTSSFFFLWKKKKRTAVIHQAAWADLSAFTHVNIYGITAMFA